MKAAPVLISACLLGVRCRYDGGHSLCPDLISALASAHSVPFCPEQLGGLPTPRPPANITHGNGSDVLDGIGKVIDVQERDVTEAFKKGAFEALHLARLLGASVAVVKDRSPSCGLLNASRPYVLKGRVEEDFGAVTLTVQWVGFVDRGHSSGYKGNRTQRKA